MVKNAAYNDSVVGRIVMAEPVASVIAAPSHVRPSQQAIEESLIQIFEDIFQVIGSPWALSIRLRPRICRTGWLFLVMSCAEMCRR